MKKITAIQNALDRQVAAHSSAERILPLARAEAAKRLNITLTELEADRLATAILSANDGLAKLDLNPPCGLGATEEAIQATVQALLDELKDSLTSVMEDVISEISEAIPEVLAKAAEIFDVHILENVLHHRSQLYKAHAERVQEVADRKASLRPRVAQHHRCAGLEGYAILAQFRRCTLHTDPVGASRQAPPHRIAERSAAASK